MAIKEISSSRKMEYESPDGETWLLEYVEISDRKYVQISRGNDSPVVYDRDMLYGLVDLLRDITEPRQKVRPNLSRPTLIDHRRDSNANVPVVSNNASNWDQYRTGVNVESLGSDRPGFVAQDTPEEFVIEESENIPDWKKDVLARKGMSKPTGIGFKKGLRRVPAKDIL